MAVGGRLTFRLLGDIDSDVGDEVLDLAELLPTVLADLLHNSVVHQAAVGCWPGREDRLLDTARDLVRRNPGSIAYSDTLGALLTSIGNYDEGLMLMLDAEQTVAELPRWGPGMRRQVALWHMFVAVALHMTGGEPAIANRHLRAAREEDISSPLMDLLPDP